MTSISSYTRHVCPVSFPLCSSGRGSKTAKHILIHCSAFSTAQHQLRDGQGRLPDFKQLLSTSEGRRKVSDGCSKEGSWASTGGPGVSFTRLGLLPQPTFWLEDNLGTAGYSDLLGQQVDLKTIERQVLNLKRVFFFLLLDRSSAWATPDTV